MHKLQQFRGGSWNGIKRRKASAIVVWAGVSEQADGDDAVAAAGKQPYEVRLLGCSVPPTHSR